MELLFVLIGVVIGVVAGRNSVQFPSEEAMLQRIKRLRAERRIREEVETAVEKEVSP